MGFGELEVGGAHDFGRLVPICLRRWELKIIQVLIREVRFRASNREVVQVVVKVVEVFQVFDIERCSNQPRL